MWTVAHPSDQNQVKNVALDTVYRWRALVKSPNPASLDALLAEDVVFHSPVVHTPQNGKAVTVGYLNAAFQVLFNESFRYTREVIGTQDAVLEFQVEIEGIQVNGVDMMRWNESGQIVDFKVMIRPLKAINLIHQKMAALLLAPTANRQADRRC